MLNCNFFGLFNIVLFLKYNIGLIRSTSFLLLPCVYLLFLGCNDLKYSKKSVSNIKTDYLFMTCTFLTKFNDYL